MPGVFKIDKDGIPRLSEDALKLTIHLGKLKSDELLYVILTYDYIDSPYRQKPLSLRKRQAILRIWGNKLNIDPESTKQMKEAIKEYRSLIFDQKRELLERYEEKIQVLQLDFIKADTSSAIKNVSDSIKIVIAQKESLDYDIRTNEQLVILKGERKLTWLEEMKKNNDLFKKDPLSSKYDEEIARSGIKK